MALSRLHLTTRLPVIYLNVILLISLYSKRRFPTNTYTKILYMSSLYHLTLATCQTHHSPLSFTTLDALHTSQIALLLVWVHLRSGPPNGELTDNLGIAKDLEGNGHSLIEEEV
jgi:hypothetical protein